MFSYPGKLIKVAKELFLREQFTKDVVPIDNKNHKIESRRIYFTLLDIS